MAYAAIGAVVRQIESLFDGGSVAGLTDRQLLERYSARRDAVGEAAFAALVTRYGPMVLHVCRQLLGDVHHAEDAFQAVFLVLARKARSIRDPDLLGNWLYGVALRTARSAKHRLARQRINEEGSSMWRSGSGLSSSVVLEPVDQSLLTREQAEVLHDEIARLPRSFRRPVVLCYFEGLTLDEAASRLRCPAGTVRSRIARARDKLHRGLTSRGVTLPAAALAAALSPRSASADFSSLLCDSTTKAAIHFAAGQAVGGVISTSVTALAHEVLRSMLINKLKLTVLTLLAFGAVATGAGFVGQAPVPQNRQAGKPGVRQIAAKPDDANAKPVAGRMTVTGRVLDPAGKPIAKVPVDVIGRPRRVYSPADGFGSPVLLGHGDTDSDGRFRLDASRTSSVGFFDGVYVLATAPGFGLGWAQLNPDAEHPVAEIRLRTEQLIRGKLVDLNGQPAAGVELRVFGLGEVKKVKNLGLWPETSLYDSAPAEAQTWPHWPKTDDQGRFEFHGVARGHFVSFVVNDLRFAQQWLDVTTDDRNGPKEVTLTLQPAKIIEGRALAADTGQPIPGAAIDVGADTRTGIHPTRFRTDAQGRFRANPYPADHFTVGAFPPEGLPYLPSRVGFAWTKGAVTKEIDVKLPRGIVIKGKVTEEGTGRALAGASVQYLAINGSAENKGGWEAMVASKDDGSYQIAVPPGKGHLLVFGPTSNFILELIGGQMLSDGIPGGERNYAHKIMAYEVKAGDPPHALDALLRPGKTIKGHVVGPRGETIEHAAILTRLQIEPFNTSWRGSVSFQLHARDGAFELHGLDPEKSATAYLLDADHQWGATIEASGKQAGDDVTVRLQPCGQARARFIGPDGKPVAELIPPIEIVVTPGPPARRGELSADAAHLIDVDPKHYWRLRRLVTDADGRITLPDLIPGALYRISDYKPTKGWQVRDFTVKPGEILELGDILIQKPQS